MLQNRMTLGEIAKRLMMHAESFGSWFVSSLGYSFSDGHYHSVALQDNKGNEMTLSIPMYQEQAEATPQAAVAIEQYMLIHACEITFSKPQIYNSKDEVFEAMIGEFSNKSGIPAETLKRHFAEGTLEELSEEFRDEYGIEAESAWIIDGENHDNYIWEIYRLTTQDNRITKCE